MTGELGILLSGPVALSGAVKIVSSRKEELLERFPPRLTEKIMKTDIAGLTRAAKENILSESCVYMSELGGGGFFSGLWYMAGGLKKGFSVDMYKVPVFQEIIEICELYDVNPYITESKGSVLMVSSTPGTQLEAFRRAGCDACIIGYTEKGKDKKLIIGDRIRFLDRPAPDEVERFT